MSVRYDPHPLTEEVKAWLREKGVSFPEAAGRWPTSNELRAALESLAGYSVSYRGGGDGWDAEVVDPRTGYKGYWYALVCSLDDTDITDVADDETPAKFWFHKAAPELALMILEKLSHACGPYVLIDDSSLTPSIVVPGCDVTELAAVYH